MLKPLEVLQRELSGSSFQDALSLPVNAPVELLLELLPQSDSLSFLWGSWQVQNILKWLRQTFSSHVFPPPSNGKTWNAVMCEDMNLAVFLYREEEFDI